MEFLHLYSEDYCQWYYLVGIEKHLNDSLMLVTALNPVIGYDKAAQVVKKAFNEHKTLKQAALELEFLSEAEFDQHMDPKKMTGA